MQAQATKKITKAKTDKPQKKKKAVGLDKTKSRWGWVFVAPFAISLLTIYIPVLINSIRFSFSKITTVKGGGFTIESVGFANYQDAFFNDPEFVKTLIVSLKAMVLDIPAIVIFALFMAVLTAMPSAARSVSKV